jgi:3-hydroxyisobutyrate dehydrogenase-like beta-hydroxyacid dehydrogenase
MTVKGMAANLLKAGHQLVVHDLSRAAAEPFLAKGAVWANSPKEVAAQSEAVFTSLPVPADVEQVALGPNGLIEGMRPDTAFFDMSTNSVAMVRKINAAFAEKNLYMLGRFLSGPHDPADFALRLLHKDVGLAVGLGREVGVPMRLANMAYEELTEAMNRGWGTRNSTVGQLLQVERSGIEPPAVDPKRVQAILDADKPK